MVINFSAPLEAVAFPRPSSNGKRRFNPPRYTEFKAALGLFARRAMNGICYLDDAQVIVGTFTKNRGDPHIDIQLEEL